MLKYLHNEYKDFEIHHKDKINKMIHVITGIIYMSCLNVIFNNNLILLYTVLLFVTLKDLRITVITILLIYIGSLILEKMELSNNTLIILFFITTFVVPELSHLYSKEMKVLNSKDISIMKLLINIVYFLPFSIKLFIDNK